MMSPKHQSSQHPVAVSGSPSAKKQSTYRIAAGFILLAMAIASPIGFLVALPEGPYAITVFVGFVVVVLDVCVAVALIPIVQSGGPALANWASVLRFLYATGLLTATIILADWKVHRSFQHGVVVPTK